MESSLFLYRIYIQIAGFKILPLPKLIIAISPTLLFVIIIPDVHVCERVCICAVQKPAVPGDAVVNAELHLLERLLGRITQQGPSKRCM